MQTVECCFRLQGALTIAIPSKDSRGVRPFDHLNFPRRASHLGRKKSLKRSAVMQSVHEHISVAVTKHALRTHPQRRSSSSTRDATTASLQYVGVNSGFDIVTLRVDFRESDNIRLHFPTGTKSHAHYAPESTTDKTSEKLSHPLVFDCKLYPFEQRVLVYVIKVAKQRALVRVEYSVLSVDTPPMDAIIESKANTAEAIQQLLHQSNRVFNYLSKWSSVPCVPEEEIDRVCAEVNQYCQQHGDIFMDASFPPTETSLYDPTLSAELPDAEASVYSLYTWRHLHDILDSSWTFTKKRFQDSPLRRSALYTSGLPQQDSFLCALSILESERDFWLGRWFPSLNAASTMEEELIVPVVLYDLSLVRRQFVIDLFLPAFPLGQGLVAPHNPSGECFAMLLHKAFAKLKGSYAAVTSVPTISILTELTGFPWVCLYRTASGVDDSQQSSDQDRFRRHVQNAQWRYSRFGGHEPLNPSLIVVSFGKLDGGHRAYRVVFPEDSNQCVSWLHLHDGYGYLRESIRGSALEAQPETAKDLADVQLSWEEFFTLKPIVWSLSLAQQYKRCTRRVLTQPTNSTATMSFALSVPALSTLVFSVSYASHFAVWARAARKKEGHQTRVEMWVNLAFVEKDFSLVPCIVEGEDNEALSAASNKMEKGTDDEVLTIQMKKTLSAGEYILSIHVKRKNSSDVAPESLESLDPSESTVVEAADDLVLTRNTVDANLRLLFDYLDSEARQSLTATDLETFVHFVEHVGILTHEYSAFYDFVAHHGSVVRRESGERALTLDDLREIYASLTPPSMATCEATCTTSTSDNSPGSVCDLVWEDLNHVLSSLGDTAAEEIITEGDKSGDGAQASQEQISSQLDRRKLSVLVCCIHSDTPLLNVTALPRR